MNPAAPVTSACRMTTDSTSRSRPAGSRRRIRGGSTASSSRRCARGRRGSARRRRTARGPARAARPRARAACRLVISAPTTNTTPVATLRHDRRVGHRHDRRRVDDDPVEVLLQRRQEVAEALRAEQLRRVRRNAARPPAPTARARASCARSRSPSRCPPAGSTAPAPALRPKTSCTRGRRMSASISSTRWPACAKPIARLLATSRLALAGAGARDDQRRASLPPPTRTARWSGSSRNASAKPGGTPACMQRLAVLPRLGVERRHHPEGRQPEVRLDLVGRLDAAVEVLEEERQPEGAGRCRRHQRQQQVQPLARRDRRCAAAPPGRRRGCCWSSARRRRRSPSCAAAGCRRAACCSARRARARCSRCPCGSSTALRPSAGRARTTRLLSCASAAWYSLRTDCTTLAISACSFACALWIADAGLDDLRVLLAELLRQLRAAAAAAAPARPSAAG